MNIAVIDADLIGRKRHRFPNLACEKIAGYWKSRGADVELKTDYFFLDTYDEVFISKVFTDTPLPDFVTPSEKIHIGGTGFYFDKAEPLPYAIEHQMPDYNLYDEFITSTGGGNSSVNTGITPLDSLPAAVLENAVFA